MRAEMPRNGRSATNVQAQRSRERRVHLRGEQNPGHQSVIRSIGWSYR